MFKTKHYTILQSNIDVTTSRSKSPSEREARYRSVRCYALTRCSAPFSCKPLRGWYFSSARSDTSSRTCATLALFSLTLGLTSGVL